MELLEYFYNRNNEVTIYYPRKLSITKANKTLIYGSPASGKSSLVLDYLVKFNSIDTLYIDFSDPKFQFGDIIEEDIEAFIKLNNINILVLDHYQHGYFQRFPIVKELIVVSDEFHDYGDGFNIIEVPLLDYEEFFSFQKQNSEKQIFNLFLKRGTLPQLAVVQSVPKEQLFQIFIKSHFNQSEQKLLNILAHFNGSVVTTFQIYSYA